MLTPIVVACIAEITTIGQSAATGFSEVNAGNPFLTGRFDMPINGPNQRPATERPDNDHVALRSDLVAKALALGSVRCHAPDFFDPLKAVEAVNACCTRICLLPVRLARADTEKLVQK